jgi:hypothetical protein
MMDFSATAKVAAITGGKLNVLNNAGDGGPNSIKSLGD